MPQGSRRRRLAQAMGLLFNDDGTWGPLHLRTASGARMLSADGSLADQLRGRTFLSEEVTGRDLVRETTIEIRFGTDGQLHVSAGCNLMSGPVRWDGPRLSVSHLGATEMACDQPLMDQDAWFATLLQSGLDAALDGDTLTLAGREERLQFVDRVTADPDRPLESTTWTLDSVIIGTGPTCAWSPVPEDLSAILLIAEGRIHFCDGRKDYNGAVTVTTDTVQVRGDVASSPTDSESATAEPTDMSVLTEDFHDQITARQLIVTGASDTGLVFVAANEDSTATG